MAKAFIRDAVRMAPPPDDAEHVNPHRGAIALGHPAKKSGARLVQAALNGSHRRRARHAPATSCIGAGQDTVMIIEGI